jgi:uncharacterized protein
MSDHKKLAALYSAIPSFACKEGCHDCCGPVPVSKGEWQRIKLEPRLKGLGCVSCAYLNDGCSIYENRPYLCRLFGATVEAKMRCPHGCGPEKPLTQKQTDILTKRYMKLMGASPAALTADLN